VAGRGAAARPDGVGSTDDADVTVAQLLMGSGWSLEGGQPIDRPAVAGLIADDAHLLRRVGAFERDRRGGWPGAVTPEGAALARAALATPHG
jgi:hypothetical protein